MGMQFDKDGIADEAGATQSSSKQAMLMLPRMGLTQAEFSAIRASYLDFIKANINNLPLEHKSLEPDEKTGVLKWLKEVNDIHLIEQEKVFNYLKMVGHFVGKQLLGQSVNNTATYPIYHDNQCLVMVPFGPIQSIIHLICLPKRPIYNAVTLQRADIPLIEHMSAVNKKCVKWILTPGTKIRELYLDALKKALVLIPKHKDEATGKMVGVHESIIIKQSHLAEPFDTTPLHGKPEKVASYIGIVSKKLDDYAARYADNMDQAISTTLHHHPKITVGHLHMHAFLAQASMITDNGKALLFKNTAVDIVIRALNEDGVAGNNRVSQRYSSLNGM